MHEDPLGPARGMLYGLMLGGFLWAAIIIGILAMFWRC
jgi:hypothetical protein